MSHGGRGWIDRLATYCEISPSGTGVKLYGTVERLPPTLMQNGKPKGLEATPPDAAVPAGAENASHKVPEVGLYPCERYFALTGQQLDGTPDELTDITEAFAEIAHEVASMTRDAGKTGDLPSIDWEKLPAELREIMEGDEKLREAWAGGAKLGKGRDASASGLEWSLMRHLAWRSLR